ncbi:MAG: hypothetical protein ACC707_02745 [Thiohalomonadales bacterium]
MMNRRKFSPHRIAWTQLAGLAVFALITANAHGISIPDDERQSIVYWKPHLIPDTVTEVAQVKQIFAVLLRTWNNSRIAPSIHVVKSTTGPWAASLADGNILLSMDAVKISLSFGKNRAQHLLAFVLAHELAHQRSDDLWHQKFFRLIGTQTPEKQKQLLRGIDKQWLRDIEQKEAQADHDALVMMASVGYDPFQVSTNNDFFRTWVEQIWKNSCASTPSTHPAKSACAKAETRSLRAQTQLETTATQTTLYELALQFFVAGDLTQARKLFKIYGRELPSRAVYTGIGLTYLSEAISLKHDKKFILATNGLAFYYPIALDTRPEADKISTGTDNMKRGEPVQLKKQTARIHQLVSDAIHYFERASKLEPNHRHPYLLLSIAYLIDDNTFMARGILQGKYKPTFGTDSAFELILAMTTALEGKTQAAIKKLQRLTRAGIEPTSNSDTLPASLIQYTANYNLSQLYKKQKLKKKSVLLWQQLAKQSKQTGDTLLFRMALSQLNATTTHAVPLSQYPSIQSHRPGDVVDFSAVTQNNQLAEVRHNEIWIEGEKRLLFRIPDSGARFFVNSENKILNAWQQWSTNATIGRLSMGDPSERAHKVFGIPDREIFFTRGTYLAYDNFGFGLYIVNNKISGWFLYGKT